MPTKVIIRTPGPQGAPGIGEATAAYVHTQPTPASTWIITHNLGYRPNATIVDSSGGVVYGDLIYNSVNQMTATFGGAFSGFAYLS